VSKNLPSLQRQLLVLVLGLVISVWLATAALTWVDVRQELDELLDSHLAQAAALLLVQRAHDIDEDDHGVDAPILHRYVPKVMFQVFHEGRLMLRSANAPEKAMINPGLQFKKGFTTVQIGGEAWRVFATFGHEADIQVYVAEQTSARSSILWAILRSTMWPMLIALPLLALAAWWAVQRGVAPIRRLGRAVADRQTEALHPVAIEGITSEMLPLVEALNSLFSRIGNLLESERRFTADAAHELRTPIAAIRAQAQVALGEADDDLRRQALRNTLEGCDRATRLVEQLMTLSRLEAHAEPALAAVDLTALARQTVGELALKALGKEQSLEFDAADAVAIPGNETLLAVLVRNLVDNAVRYSPPSVRVRVRVEQQAGRAVLTIEDGGPGLDEAERIKLGERFFRMPGSAESGSGLGWSIVRRIAAVHHLELQAERSTELGGLAVRVSGRIHCGNE